ncbi:restriction endonuclease [Actinomycetospora sp. NBRC 106378]|nr:restriction endonuclease [Actinomycetospora sp. NBRC 106378]
MPTWEGFLRPVLSVLADGAPRSARDVADTAADILELTPEQRLETINSGMERYRDRSSWAMSALARAGAVARPKRGTYIIAEQGQSLLAASPSGLTESRLLLIPAYRDYVPSKKQTTTATISDDFTTDPGALSPHEQISAGVNQIHQDVALELIRRLRDMKPVDFEQIVLKLLVAMNYGGSAGERARHIGGSADGGVDGVIDQDPLGLGRIYVQAKRYAADNVVGRPAIQGFVGALHGQQANQGVFITTSSFSKEAGEYARQVNAAVVLIDGKRLTDLMIQYRVGVQIEQIYTVVKVDEDYFES